MRQRYGPWSYRVALCASALLAIELVFAASFAWSTFTRSGPSQAGFGIDFSVYWSAASAALPDRLQASTASRATGRVRPIRCLRSRRAHLIAHT